RCLTDNEVSWSAVPENHCTPNNLTVPMKGFRTVGSAQRFLASFSRISPHLRTPRHRMTATDHRTELATRFQVWNQVTEQTLAA
ncbi:hypothetical protein R3Q06_33875, partial [Rhodococcus erythropolis]|nr:hypothetical protein [Rhodococcus erythropolis]